MLVLVSNLHRSLYMQESFWILSTRRTACLLILLFSSQVCVQGSTLHASVNIIFMYKALETIIRIVSDSAAGIVKDCMREKLMFPHMLSPYQ